MPVLFMGPNVYYYYLFIIIIIFFIVLGWLVFDDVSAKSVTKRKCVETLDVNRQALVEECSLPAVTTGVTTGIFSHSLPEWAFRARYGLWRIRLCPKVARIVEHKFSSR